MRAAKIVLDEHHTPSHAQTVFNQTVKEPVYVDTKRVAASWVEQPGARPTLSITDAPVARAYRRRQISQQNGRALEVLGHAIEYVADEFAVQLDTSAPLTAKNPQVQAMQILMAANRNVYYHCPIAPTLGERFRDFWSRRMQFFRLRENS
jgi:hypothetical protein